MNDTQKKIWGMIGAGAVVLTAVGVYLYVRSLRERPANVKVKMVEDIIREAEDLMRRQRSAPKRQL